MTTTTDPRNIDPRDIIGPELVAEIETLKAELRAELEHAARLAPRIYRAFGSISDRITGVANLLPNRGELDTGGFYQDGWLNELSTELYRLAADVSEAFMPH